MPPAVSTASRRTGGFTLLELLIVIAIIAILAGLLFAVGGTVQTRSRRIQALNDLRNVKLAVTSYYTDNRKYPINKNQSDAATPDYGGYDTVYGDIGGLYSSADLFNILRAEPDDKFNKDNQLNPSKTAYWEGPYAKSATAPHEGITTKDVKDGENIIPKGSLVDPWGNPYVVWVDASRNGDLTTAYKWFYDDIQDGEGKTGQPPLGIESASLGPDGEWGTHENKKLTGSDDITTWDHLTSKQN